MKEDIGNKDSKCRLRHAMPCFETPVTAFTFKNFAWTVTSIFKTSYSYLSKEQNGTQKFQSIVVWVYTLYHQELDTLCVFVSFYPNIFY